MSDETLQLATQLGHAGWHEHEVRGVALFDLDSRVASIPELALLVLGVQTTDPRAAEILEACARSILNPDPRIPPMKLVRLGAAHGRIGPGLAAVFVGLEGANLGMSVVESTAEFLCAIDRAIGKDFDEPSLDAFLLEHRHSGERIYGFGVAGRPTDERWEWLSKQLEGVASGPRAWWRLFERAAAMLGRQGRKPSVSGGLAAAMLDLGCSPAQVGALAHLCGILPLLGNALEGAEQAPELLRVLPASCVEYVGRPPRISPRAAGADEG